VIAGLTTPFRFDPVEIAPQQRQSCAPKYGRFEPHMLVHSWMGFDPNLSRAVAEKNWIADRQSGPLTLRLGTEAQRLKYIPEIISGDACFCIGLSEHNAGSDLASVRRRARDAWS